MLSTAQLTEALADLALQEFPDFTTTAKKYNCVLSTLRRRFWCKTSSREEVTDIYYSALTRA
jgi:hypothetical protein